MSRTILVLALGCLVAGLVGGVVAYRSAGSLGEDAWPFDLDDGHAALPRLMGPPWVMRTIYLNRRGGTLVAGRDDAPHGRSSVLEFNKKPRAELPAFKGTDASWRKLVACVRAKFAPFDVEVVEERPAQDHVLVMVGGTPEAVGARRGVSGLAPYNGWPIEDPVVFVFSRALRENVRAMCETAAMEVAHAYGLDHELLCKDPMTYLPRCGEKQFQDVAARCGEKKPRPCGDGAPVQNSFARLMQVLGPSRKAEAAAGAAVR